jgi:hypothetical protein
MYPLSNFLDFYILTAMQHFVSQDPQSEFSHSKSRLLGDIEYELSSLSGDMAQALRDYIFLSSFGEARHANNTIRYKINEIPDCVERANAYAIALNFNPEKSYPVLKELFECNGWNSSLGGALWANVIDAYGLYNKMPAGAFVDYCADLKHNGGLFLNKPVVFYQYYDSDDLQYILSQKRDAENFCAKAIASQHSRRLYAPEYILSTTASLVRRYEVIFLGSSIGFWGNKKCLGYQPAKFGDGTLTIVENEFYMECEKCGESFHKDHMHLYADMYYCDECINEVIPKRYCDACGKERTSTNEYIFEEKSMCHACYDKYTALAKHKKEICYSVGVTDVIDV